MQNYHAVVWLDHHEARIFFFDRHAFKEIDLGATKPHAHLHTKAGTRSGKKPAVDSEFYHHIVEALKPATEWLVLGPGTAKLELVKHVHKHDHQFEDRIVGVETADHPSDRQIVAHGRDYFKPLAEKGLR
jgi:stalled ribosome rescue protein Dom34